MRLSLKPKLWALPAFLCEIETLGQDLRYEVIVRVIKANQDQTGTLVIFTF